MSFHGSQKLNPKNFKPIEMTRVYNGCDCYDWKEIFVFWPVKTVSGKYVFFRKVYKRKFWTVWGNGFHMETEVEYAELFEILKYGHN